MRDQPGFFDVDDRLKGLSDLGDQLEGFRAAVDFEMFRPDLDSALAYSDGAQGGRPPFDPVMMFKVLVIQTTNNLSDERAEFLINDRLSFMRFLGLGLSDRIPNARTIWLFREKLTKASMIGPLVERFANERAFNRSIVSTSAEPLGSTTRRVCLFEPGS
jgi:transposase, IS5 family